MSTSEGCPTIVSIYQNASEKPGCGYNCLGPCCIPGAKLPVYAYGKSQLAKHAGKGSEAQNSENYESDCSDEEAGAFLNSLLLAQWEDRMNKGLFRYDVTACETKVLAGEYGFVAQLNEGRHLKKRPTEFCVDQVLQPFDETKFNFRKIGQDEVLFCFEEQRDGKSAFYESVVVGDRPNVVAINVSPIEYGHVLLIPKVQECKPQQVDEESFRLALSFAAEADNPYFRVGYNSLGAFATINHLHFQAYYLAVPFAVERASLRKLLWIPLGGIKVSELAEFPVRGLVYESSRLEELSKVVSKACMALQESNIPFNVLIADRGQRIFVFPQCFAERQARGEVRPDILDTQVNPAVWEISGHIVLKRKHDYEGATQESAWSLLSEVSLDQTHFNQVKEMCLQTQPPLVSPMFDALGKSNSGGKPSSLQPDCCSKLLKLDCHF